MTPCLVAMANTTSRMNGVYLQDRTKSGSLADQYKVAFTQERDADNPMMLRRPVVKLILSTILNLLGW